MRDGRTDRRTDGQTDDMVEENSDQTDELQEHLENLFQNSIKDLPQNQIPMVKNLLTEHQDVFAKTDLDLGNFTALYHEIDTGNAKPVKMRMRRTPSHFEGEEEIHLKKMRSPSKMFFHYLWSINVWTP